jgi:hypothetical protein
MPIREILRRLTPEPIRLLKRQAFRAREAEIALRARYLHVHDRPYDPSNISTFTDKLFRRMIEMNVKADWRCTKFADKLAVRDFVRKTVGEHHLTQLIWTGTAPTEIPFDELPKCIIKTNHGCGGHIIYDASIDRQSIINRLRKALSENYYWLCESTNITKSSRVF